MKRTHKNILAIVIAVALVLTCLPISTLAGSSSQEQAAVTQTGTADTDTGDAVPEEDSAAAEPVPAIPAEPGTAAEEPEVTAEEPAPGPAEETPALVDAAPSLAAAPNATDGTEAPEPDEDKAVAAAAGDTMLVSISLSGANLSATADWTRRQGTNDYYLINATRLADAKAAVEAYLDGANAQYLHTVTGWTYRRGSTTATYTYAANIANLYTAEVRSGQVNSLTPVYTQTLKPKAKTVYTLNFFKDDKASTPMSSADFSAEEGSGYTLKDTDFPGGVDYLAYWVNREDLADATEYLAGTVLAQQNGVDSIIINLVPKLTDPLEQFDVTFVAGDNEYAVEQSHPRTGLVTAPTAPDPAEYGAITFRGWFVEEDPGDDATPFDFSTQITEATTLYAVFGTDYLVKYKDSSTGDIVYTDVLYPGDRIYPSSTAAGKLEVPAGSYFKHWYQVGEDPEVAYTFGDEITADLVLVSYYSDEYVVYFVSDGTQVEPQTVSSGQRATKPSDPTRTGYTFKGWADEGGNTFNFSTPITEDTFLFAQWNSTKVSYTIALWREKANVEGDPGTNTANYEYYGSITGQQAGAGTNLTFTGSESILNSKVKYAQFHHSDTVTVAGNGTTVINVYFSRIIYTYKFNLKTTPVYGSGNISYSNVSNLSGGTMTVDGVDYTYSGSQYTLQAKYGQTLTSFPTSGVAAFSDLNFRSGSNRTAKFSGWTNTPGSNTWVTKRLVLTDDMIASGDTYRAATYTLNALWNTNGVEKKVNYYLQVLEGPSDRTYNGKNYARSSEYSQTFNSASSNLSAKDIDGYSVVKVNGNDYPGQIGSSNTWDFYYNLNSSTLKFETFGGTSINSVTGVMYGEPLSKYKPKDPVLEGYNFLGWYYDAKCEDWAKVDFTNDTMNVKTAGGELTLYAKYASNEFTATFYDKLNGTEVGKTTFGKGEYVSPSDKYTVGTYYEGYGTFLGWQWLIGTKLIDFNFSGVQVQKDISLYAKWQTDSFVLTYTPGAGSGTVPVDNEKYKMNAYTRVQGADGLTAPAGNVFLYWHVIEGTGMGSVYYPGSKICMKGDIVLEAVFADANKITTITYEPNNPAANEQAFTNNVLKNSTFPLASDSAFTAAKQKLVGWSQNKNAKPGGSDVYAPGDMFAIGTTAVTMYAVWDLKDPVVTYVLETGGGSLTGQTTFEVPSGTLWEDALANYITEPVPVPDPGYYFTGWKNVPENDFALESDHTIYSAFAQVEEVLLGIDAAPANLTKVYGEDDPAFKLALPADAPAGLADWLEVVRVKTGNNGEDVGEYTLKIQLKAGKTEAQLAAAYHGYKIIYSDTAIFTITKKTVTLTADSSLGNPFKGAPYTVNTFKAEGLVAKFGDSITGIAAFGQREAPGTSGVLFTTENPGNPKGTIHENSNTITNDLDEAAQTLPDSTNYTFVLVTGEVEVLAPGSDIPENPALTYSVQGTDQTPAYNGALQTNNTFDYAITGYDVGVQPGQFTLSGVTATAERTNVSDAADSATPVTATQAIDHAGFAAVYVSSIDAENAAGPIDATGWFTRGTDKPGTLTIQQQEVVVTLSGVPVDSLVLGTPEADILAGVNVVYTSFVDPETAADALLQQATVGLTNYDANTAGVYHFELTQKPIANYGNYFFNYGPDDIFINGQSVTVKEGGKLTYMPNGVNVTVPVDDTSYYESDNAPIDVTTDLSTGYWKFLGWAESPTAATPDWAYGDITGSYTFTAADETDGKVVYAVWEVDPDAVELTFNSYTGTYDGAFHSPTWSGDITGFNITYTSDVGEASGTILAYRDVKWNGSTVGSYGVKAKVTATDLAGNTHDVGAYTATVTINPKDLTVFAPDTTYTYSGSMMTNSAVGSPEGLVSGDTLALVNATAAGKDVGTYPRTFGAITVTRDQADVTANYNITRSPGNLIIEPASLTITAPSGTVSYGSSNVTYTNGGNPTYSGLMGNDDIDDILQPGNDFWFGTTYATGASAGSTHKVYFKASANGAEITDLTDHTSVYSTQNYNITLVNGTVTVGKSDLATIEVSAADLSKIYDGTPLDLLKDSVKVLDGSGNTIDPSEYDLYYEQSGSIGAFDDQHYPSITDVIDSGRVTITAIAKDNSPSYTGDASTTVTMTIDPYTVRIIAVSSGKPYGTPEDLPLTAIVSPLPTNGDAVEEGMSKDYWLTREPAGEDPGIYTVVVNLPAEVIRNSNYNFITENAEFTIFASDEMLVTWESDTLAYNGSTQYLSTTPVVIPGVAGDDMSNIELTYSDSAAGSFTETTPAALAYKDAGSYTYCVKAHDPAGRYNDVIAVANLTITQLTMTFTPDDATTTYGVAALPSLTAQVSGYARPDATAAQAEDVSSYLATNYSVGDPKGTYSIFYDEAAQAALVAKFRDLFGENYLYKFETSTLTVDPLKINVGDEGSGEDVYDALMEIGGYSKLYGDVDPTFVYVTRLADQLEEIDPNTLTGLESSITREPGENVAGSPYTVIGTLTSNNPSIIIIGEPINGILTINQRPVHITPNADGKTYGSPDPNELTATLSYSQGEPGSWEGFTPDPVLYKVTREPGEELGSYKLNVGPTIIDVSLDRQNPNYLVTTDYLEGREENEGENEFTIIPAGTVLINVASAEKMYGNVDPASFTSGITVVGLKNGDTADSLNIKVTRQPGQNVGTYSYSVTWTNNNNNNYTEIKTGSVGNFKITKRPITLVAASYTITEGDSIPAFKASLHKSTPLVNGDKTLNYSLYRNSSSTSAGTYDIVFNVGNNPNYSVTTVNGLLTINALAAPVPAPAPVVVPAAPVAVAVPGPVVAAPAAPAQPAAPAPVETVPADPTPTTEAPVTITDDPVPLANTTAEWALLNLIIAILALLMAVIFIVGIFSRRRKADETEKEGVYRAANREEQEEQQEAKKGKTGLPWRVIAIIVGILSPIVFLITENVLNPMIFVDRWTLLMVVLLVVQVIFMLILRIARRKPGEGDDEEKQNPAQA